MGFKANQDALSLSGRGPENQICQVHSHLLERTMRHRAEIQNPIYLRALTSAYLNAQCGTGQRSKTQFTHVHSHPLERTMRHRAEIQNPIYPRALTSACTHNAAQGIPKKKTAMAECCNQMQKFVSTSTKLKNTRPCLPL